MQNISLNQLHNYLTKKLDLECDVHWSGSHINKYYKKEIIGDWNGIIPFNLNIPVKNTKKKNVQQNRNISSIAKNISKFMNNGDDWKYLKYKDEIMEFLKQK